MDKILPLFPLNSKVVKDDVKSLLITIVIYVVAAVLFGVVIGLLGMIPILGILFKIIGALAEIYVIAGIIIAVYSFLV